MLGERAWSVWSCDAHLLLTDTDPAILDATHTIAAERLREIGDACDRFRAESEVRRLPGGVATVVSPMLQRLVDAALETAVRTDGRCDPTLGAAIRALGYDRDIRLVLDDDRPVRVVVRARRSWELVRLEGDRLTVPEGVELDLGATAKAFAADLIAAELAEHFGCGVLMNLGGDMATAGAGPRAGWQVLVRDLPGDPAARVTLHDGFALATSSTQRRSWSRGGQRIHHILDPLTGRPAPKVWRTVSVVAPTAVEANGSATAAIVAGADAEAFLLNAGTPARLVAADGAVLTLLGWPDESKAVA
jgi:thiamine biosynthesis lipoprotein